MSPTALKNSVRGRRRRWPLVLLSVSLVLLLALIALVTLHLSKAHVNRKKVERAIARVEQDDPEWRLEQFEANRAAVPDEKNGAFAVLAAHKKLPKQWPGDIFISDIWRRHPPEQRLPPDQAARLVAELELPDREALREAREVRNFRTGRYAVTIAANPLATLVPHVDAVRKVSLLLEADAVNRAEIADFDHAVESCQAILAAGQSFGDEGFLISGLVRFRCRCFAVATLERILAQGEPSTVCLRALREQFEEESQVRTMENGLRYERAEMHKVSELLESGQWSVECLDSDGFTPSPSPTDWEKVEILWVTPMILEGHAQLLDELTDAIEFARRPLDEQMAFAERSYNRWKQLNPYARHLMPLLSKFVEAEVRSVAELRCAVVAVSAEHYRRKTGHWPTALADLAADFPKGLPADPFDGEPLRFKQLPDGIVIYSVGQDRTDDGGALTLPGSKSLRGQGNDIGIRLWDVDKRRQPALAAPGP